MFQHIFELPVNQPELPANKRSLYQLLTAAITSITIFQALTGLAIFVIAGLALAGYLDSPENIHWLFLVAGINILDSLLHIPISSLLRREKLELVAILLMAVNGALSAAQILLWEEITWFPILLVLSAVIILGITPGLPIRYKIIIAAIGTAFLTGIIIADAQISYPRLNLSNLNHYIAFIFYILFTGAMLAVGIINGLINFQTLSRRLVTIFTTVTVITIIIFISIGSTVNYLESRKKAFEQLETISNLKASQINLVLERLKRQASQPITDIAVLRLSQSILTSNPESAITKIDIEVFRSYLSRIPRETGEEYLLIDANNRVLVSTKSTHQGLDLSSLSLAEKARQGLPFAIEKDFPGVPDKYSLIALTPVSVQNRFVGLLALRTTLGIINDIAQIVPTTNQTLETYLVTQVRESTVPTTEIRQEVETIDTYAVQQAFDQNATGKRETYLNYAGKEVFGHFIWIPDLQSVLISEIEQTEVFAGITNALPTYLAIGFVMILLVFVTVVITAQTISRPIQEFAQKAAALASGELSIRIHSERQDELGGLAASFNTMASELETTVRTLETKVEERTKDLQKQANYMRIAAEVARDATTAQDLDELLNRAAQLILDRFHFYHTGIFLVDADQEYAVLRASPTEAGRKMLEQGHRLRLGQVGLVGYVAATGTPRIALDTGQDTTYFNNPLLPNTRSEVAIPLKLDDRVLGVLDVQSTQPEAFTQDDVATLQVMADQLALAIQRVELVSNLQRNLKELETTYQAFTSESWQQFSQEKDFKPGYLFDGLKITPLDSFPANVQEALSKGRTVIIPPKQEPYGATAVTPLKLREQVIGGIALRFQTPVIDPDTISLVEETAGRLAVALENARLYEETQNLVQRERTVSEISSRITTSFNVENILRAAVMEIGKRMPEAEVIVELEPNKD